MVFDVVIFFEDSRGVSLSLGYFMWNIEFILELESISGSFSPI